jgi:phosphate butyryltransferase
MFKTYDELVEEAKRYAPMRMAVAAAQEDSAIEAVKQAESAGLVEATLIGDRDAILRLSEEAGYTPRGEQIVHVPDGDAAAAEAVRRASSGEADLVMKGILQTSTLMKAVLNKEWGLRTRSLVSHIFLIRLPGYHKFLSLTDGGINISPTLEEKKAILENAIDFYHLIGLEEPKIALLAPVETVNEKIQSTIDAALLTRMAERGQIKGALLDGPLALDNAISKESVREKGIATEVGGDADVLFVANIDMGNGLFKGLVYFGKGVPAGVVLGTSKPVIITSRADSAECKFYSIALNVLYGGRKKERG